jgi:hypothetical protein
MFLALSVGSLKASNCLSLLPFFENEVTESVIIKDLEQINGRRDRQLLAFKLPTDKAKNIRSVIIDRSLVDPSFLEYLPNLVELVIIPNIKTEENYGESYLALLHGDKLKENLESLTCRLKNIDFLKGYKKLKVLQINYHNIEDFTPLHSESLQNTIEELTLDHIATMLSSTKKTLDISFLKEYKRLKKLSIHRHRQIIDFSALNSKYLQDTIETLIFDDDHDRRNI